MNANTKHLHWTGCWRNPTNIIHFVLGSMHTETFHCCLCRHRHYHWPQPQCVRSFPPPAMRYCVRRDMKSSLHRHQNRFRWRNLLMFRIEKFCLQADADIHTQDTSCAIVWVCNLNCLQTVKLQQSSSVQYLHLLFSRVYMYTHITHRHHTYNTHISENLRSWAKWRAQTTIECVRMTNGRWYKFEAAKRVCSDRCKWKA